MNTKGIKFLAVLAVLAMAFAAVAVITDAQQNDAKSYGTEDWTVVPAVMVDHTSEGEKVVPHPATYTVSTTGTGTATTDPIKVTVTAVDVKMHNAGAGPGNGAWIGFGVVLSGTGTLDAAKEVESNWTTVVSPDADGKVDITYASDVAKTTTKGEQDGAAFYKNGALKNGQTFYYLVTYTADGASQSTTKYYQVTYNLSFSSDAAAEACGYCVMDATDSAKKEYYPTLFDAVKNQNTVKQKLVMLASHKGAGFTSDNQKMNIEVDMKGYTYTVTSVVGSTGTVSQAIRVLDGQTAEFHDGTFAIDKTDATLVSKVAQFFHLYGTTTLKNVVIDGSGLRTSSYVAAIFIDNGVTSIDGCKVKMPENPHAESYPLISSSWITGSYTGSKTTITNSEFDGDIAYAFETAVPASGNASLTFNSGVVYGNLIVADGGLGSWIAPVVSPDAEKLAAWKAALVVNGGSFGGAGAIPYVAASKTVSIIDDCTYGANLAIKKNVTINLEEAVVVKVTGTVSADTEATINLGKGASFTATGEIASTVKVKTSGSDQPVDVEETDAAGKIDDKTVAEYINDKQTEAIAEATVVTMNNSNAIKDTGIVVEKADVTFVAGGATSLAGVKIEVKATETSSNSVTFTGFTDGVSGTITTSNGSDKQTIVLDGVKGSFTISKGSVIIDDAVIIGGSFKVSGGVEVKINGSVDSGIFTILMADDAKATDKATVTVVNDDEKTFEIKNGATFKIDDSRITLKVDGKLFGEGTVESKGDVVINKTGVLQFTEGGSIKDVAGSAITITANSGAKIIGKFTLAEATSSLIAYSGSDINSIDATSSIAKIVGMDENGGKWIFSAPTLNLDNYNGTYNFGAFADKIQKIDLKGDNSVSYAFAAEFTVKDVTLFGKYVKDDAAYPGITSITSSSSGSLDITIDLSKIKKDQLFDGKRLTVMVLGAAESEYHINGVNVSVTVFGENATWTTEETKLMQITGIDAKTGFKTFNASVDLDIVSDYTSKDKAKVIGLCVENAVGLDVDSATVFTVKSAGTAVKCNAGNVKISNSFGVEFNGKKMGLDTEKDDAYQNLQVKTTVGVKIAGGMDVQNVTIMESNMSVGGKANINGNVSETNSSSLSFTGTAKVEGTITTTQESSLNIKDATLGGDVTNGGYFSITGNVVLSDGATFENNVSLNNTGVIGVYGNFTNNAKFTNQGTFEMLKYKFVTTEQTFTIDDVAPTAAANARVISIKLVNGDDKTTFNADGSADVNAKVKFVLPGTAVYLDDVEFTGTLTPYIDGSYKLVLTNKDKTATITLTFNAAVTEDTKIGGKSYALAVTGTVKNASDDVFYLATNGTNAAKTADGIKTKFVASTATFTDNAGSSIVNEGTFVLSSKDTVTINGEIEGDLISNVTTTTTINGPVSGKITSNVGGVTLTADASVIGDIESKGIVTIEATAESSGAIVGNIKTDAGVTSAGVIVGNITAKGNVVVTDILGDITVDANGELTVNVKGKMAGTITYISKYKATKDAKEGEETTYTAKMDVLGQTKDGGFTVILAAGSDATASAAVVPGFFKINGTMADLATGKTVELTLTEGKLLFDAVVKMKANYYLIIEKDTTIEVNKSAASLDVTEAALKVSKDATANFETGSGTPVNYGKVIAIMSFTIDDGAYSIYSDVAYALTNCNENSTLTVESDAPINSNVDVKAGVNIIVKNVTLTFNGLDVKMGLGAKITLEGTGKVVFKGTEKDATGDENIYYYVDGTIVYDDANVIILDEVRFVADTTNTFEGVAATSTEASKIKVALTYNCGDVTIEDGYATGSVELANGELAWKDVTADPTLIRGTFIVGADAVFDATSLKDSYGVSKYKMSGDEYVVDDEVALPTRVGVEGTLNLLDATSIKGVYGGNGLLTIAKKLTIEKGDLINAEDTPFKDSPGVIGLIVSDKDGCNKLALALLAASTKAADDPIVIAAEKVKDVDALTIAGDVGVGSIIGEESAYLKGITVYEDAAITAPTVYVITAESTAFGSVGAQTIYMKSTDSSYAKLKYQVEYEVGEYTFYSYFASIDFDEVSDITIADTYALSVLAVGEDKVDLSGKDVTISIADGKELRVDMPLIIGTPIDSFGAEGSAIVGKVIIENSVAPLYKYIVAYTDVDLTEAEIYQDGGKVEAVYSVLTIDDILYATIFANEGTYDEVAKNYGNGVGLSYVDKALIPDIEGYIFTKWSNLNDDPNAAVGETSAYANAKAILVTVTVKFAEGVSYYLDGVEFAIYDTPTKVEYNSVFTAKINNTAKYEGTPLINGKNSFIVTEDATLTVSGVNPIPVPPEPEPEPVVGDSGLSLTDILLIVLVILIAIMVVILVLRLNRS